MDLEIKSKIKNNQSVKTISQDQYVNINLNNTYRTIPYNDINKTISANDILEKERQNCNKYRIVSTIKPYCTNVLFNITGTSVNDVYNENNSYFVFDKVSFRDRNENNLLTDEEDFTYLESINYYLTDSNGWLGYVAPNSGVTQNCQFIDLMPSRKYFDFTPRFDNNLNKYDYNWEVCATYPAKIDSGHTLVNNGLIIGSVSEIEYGGRNLILFKIPFKHGLSVGENININGTLNNLFDGTYKVLTLGDGVGNFEENYFIIDFEYDNEKNNTTFSDNFLLGSTKFKRLYSNRESKYYFRLFKKIDTQTSYEIYPLAFSKNIYGDRITQVAFNDEIDLGLITDYMGRPISEIYLSVIKCNTHDDIFSDVKAGLDIIPIAELDELTEIMDIHRIHNRSGYTQNSDNYPAISHSSFNQLNDSGNTFNNVFKVEDTDEYFYGDLVEWNDLEQIEKVLCDVNHRFNTINRDYCDLTKNSGCPFIVIQNGELVTAPITNQNDTGYTYIDYYPRVEGYYYKPHNKIKIKYFSDYIEQGDTGTTLIPSYATQIDSNLFLWRDVNDIGYINEEGQTIDYPFLNNAHYLYNDINFYLKRQDPFGEYGLLFNGTPNDVYGEFFNVSDIYNNLNNNSDGC